MPSSAVFLIPTMHTFNHPFISKGLSTVAPVGALPSVRFASLAVLAVTAFVVSTSAALAKDDTEKKDAGAAQDKSSYNLFSPTPLKLMRELSTDRPDKTESPYTVDAGHFQLEMDFANFTQDRVGDQRTRTWNIAPVNLKLGLLNNVDLQLVFDSYLHERVEDRPTRTGVTTRGVGDLTTRLKVNFWGNDGGSTAFGVMPFVKTPTNSNGVGNNKVEGGVIFPLAVSLPGGWGMGLMTEFDFLHNETDSGYHTEFINSVTFSHDIVGKLGGYVEFFSNTSTERGSRFIGTVDLGLTYGVTDNIQLDAGCNIGVTKAAEDVQPFVGISMRF
jgi:hypothetical protein